MSNGVPSCEAPHCSGIQGQVNSTCKANGWPVNNLVMICDREGNCCTCTCSCLSYNTPVLIPNDQEKNIQDFKVGDLVVAFNPDGTSANHKVGFSNGTDANAVQPEMAYITYEFEGASRTIVVTLDHTFLRPDGKLIRAAMLRPGMPLVLGAGGTTNVDGYEVKGYTGGVWNISTTTTPPTSLDGHLLDTRGVLSGDYTVQLYYLDFAKKGLAVRTDEEPEVTTRGYDAAAGAQGLRAAQASPPSIPLVDFLAQADGPTNRLSGSRQGGGVVLHHDHSFVLEVPQGVGQQGYLTDAQADEAGKNLPPETTRTANAMTLTNWLVQVFAGFYPDVTFLIDAPNRGANAFSFFLGSQKYCLIQGGLIRAKPLDWQGLALVLAYSMSRFNGGAPYGTDGLTCKPQADYGAVGVLNKVFYPLYPTIIYPAVQQIEALFAELTDKADNPVSGCHETTLECRADTYYAAMQYLDLPECAGGPKPPLLEVTGAQGNADGTVTVSFSDFVKVVSAEKPGNYAFDPAANVSKAEVNASDGSKVSLTGDFTSGTDYKVTVSDVPSIIGYALDPAKNSAEFKMP